MPPGNWDGGVAYVGLGANGGPVDPRADEYAEADAVVGNGEDGVVTPFPGVAVGEPVGAGAAVGAVFAGVVEMEAFYDGPEV